MKFVHLWMSPTWIAASTAEESLGASATAKNAVENLSLQSLSSTPLQILPECDQVELGILSAAATSCDGFGLLVLNWMSPGDQP